MEKKEYRQLLSQRQYIRLLLADTINRFGDSIDVIAYSWIMYEITGSASLMALVVGLNFVPTVFLTPFAGAFVDRISKKRVMALADLKVVEVMRRRDFHRARAFGRVGVFVGNDGNRAVANRNDDVFAD